jgi:predicted nuclease of predicted toxin-antitoxin system
MDFRQFIGRFWETVSSDSLILKWARENELVVCANDLDFGAILTVTRAKGPSVIQVQTQDVTSKHLEDLIVRTLCQHKVILEHGALISVDEARLRSRILPLTP